MTRWNGRAGAAIALGATALAGGCALVVGFPDRTLGSSDGTGGSTTSASSSSGGASSASSSGGEGGHGGAASSSATSSSSSSGGGPPTWCDMRATKPLLCDDFESGVLASPWAHHKFDNGSAALSVEQANPWPGYSFRSWFMGAQDLTMNDGHISQDFAAVYATMHFGFDVYINLFADDGGVPTYIAELDLANGYGVLLYAVPSVATIQQRFPTPPVLGGEINSGMPLALHKWQRVEIDLSLAKGMQSSVKLTIDGAPGIQQGDLDLGWEPGVPTVRLGTVVANTKVAHDVFYDNVVFDAP